MKHKIESERLVMRPLTFEDAPSILVLDSDPDVHEFLGKQPIKDIKQAKNILEDILAQYKRNGIGRMAVIRKKDGAFMGWSGLKYEEGIRSFGYYDLGYRLIKKYWRNGYGRESAEISLKFGFEELGLDKICAAADIDNLGSNKILSGIGMSKRDRFNFDGEEHNWYEISSLEWNSEQ